jgi:probable FeS assembly SUF system protein SufT
MTLNKPITLGRDCETIEIPSGARKTLASGTSVRILQSRGGSYTVATDLGAMYRVDGKDANALGMSPPAATSAIPDGPLTEQMVIDQLKMIFDPEIPVNIVDLGLVYACTIGSRSEGEGKRIDVKMAMTAPGCGMANVLRTDVESKLSRLPQVEEVHVEIVFDPPWHAGLMSDAARLQLGMDLDDGPSPLPILQTKR